MSFFDFDDNASPTKDSSFFRDPEDNRAGEKRQVFNLEDDGHGDDTDNSKVQMKAPKKSKVDTSLGPVNIEFADITDTDRDMNDNTPSIKVEEHSNKEVGTGLLSDIMRDAIEEMRSKMLTMIPDIKRQEEASDSIVGRASVLESDINNYREQLAEVKHEYTSRLNQVSSILNRPR